MNFLYFHFNELFAAENFLLKINTGKLPEI